VVPEGDLFVVGYPLSVEAEIVWLIPERSHNPLGRVQEKSTTKPGEIS
jgi:hypothetical protein